MKLSVLCIFIFFTYVLLLKSPCEAMEIGKVDGQTNFPQSAGKYKLKVVYKLEILGDYCVG